MMEKTVIVVWRGLVQDVYSSTETDVTVIDLDTEEGQQELDETELPEFKAW